MTNKADDANNDILPRSIFAQTADPRSEIREMIDAVFSDKFMIFLSVILIPLIVLPFIFILNSTLLSFLDICDWIIVVLFVTEYLSKLYLAQNRWAHFKSPWHLLDLAIVVLPFVEFMPFLGLAITGSPSLLLRLLRLPRAFAVEARAVAGRRHPRTSASNGAAHGPETIIRQVDSNFKATTDSLSWDEFKAHLADSSHQEWLDLHYVSDEGFASLSNILGVAEPHFKSRLVDDIYPHIDYIQKASFIFLQSGEVKYPEHSDSFLTILRSGMIVICNGTKIITVSRHSIDLIDEVLDSVQNKKPEKFVVPILYGIIEQMLGDYKAILSEIELEVLKISSTPRSKLPKDFLERIYQLDKEVSRLVSNLVHFKDMLSIIISKKVPLEGFDKASEEAFHILQDSAVYLNEISRDVMDNLRSIIDLYINQTSFETNKILKILAVITAVSVIPTAVSGLIGTNLLDVPYGAYLWQITLGVTVGMIFAVYVFTKLGWLKS